MVYSCLGEIVKYTECMSQTLLLLPTHVVYKTLEAKSRHLLCHIVETQIMRCIHIALFENSLQVL